MSKVPFRQNITDLAFLLKKHSVSHVILCPGSRNAPLLQVFERDPFFHCHSIVDERSAGYVSLGMAHMLKAPVAMVSTSGTAALNFSPAMAEAYKQKIPLLAITADRPEEFPPQFSNQRINQEGIYKKNSTGFLQVMEPDSVEDLARSNEQLAELLSKMSGISPGPVHINLLLYEPLYIPVPVEESEHVRTIAGKNDMGKMIAPVKSAGAASDSADGKGKEKYNPKISKAYAIDFSPEETGKEKSNQNISDADIALVRQSFADQKEILVIAGMMDYPPEFEYTLQMLKEHSQTVIIAENLANLRSVEGISAPELVLGSIPEDGKVQLQPDLVIVFGGQVVSKRCRLFIQGLEDVQVLSFETPPFALLQEIAEKHSAENNNKYLEKWKILEKKAENKAKKFIEQCEFASLTAINKILQEIPTGTVLHLGSSATVRYAQMLPARKDLYYYSNRGTSGIDGCLSTAVGAAMVSEKLHVIILGDLSFVYDSNSLWNRDFPENLKIIVLNDRGGGIFKLIEGPDRMPFFEDYSVAHHPVEIEFLARAFGKEYISAANTGKLNNALGNLFASDSKTAVLEVDTSDSENSIIFKQFYKTLQL